MQWQTVGNQEIIRSNHQDTAVPALRARGNWIAVACDEWVACAEVAATPDLIAKSEDTKLGVFALFTAAAAVHRPG